MTIIRERDNLFVKSAFIHNVAESLGAEELKRQAVSYKIILVIVFVLCMLFTIGIVSLSSLGSIAKTTEDFSEIQIPTLNALYALDESLVKERFLVNKISLLTSSDSSEYVYLSKRLRDQGKKTEAELKILQSLVIDEKKRQMLDAAISVYRDYSFELANFLESKSAQIIQGHSSTNSNAAVVRDLSNTLDTKALTLQDSFFALGNSVREEITIKGNSLFETENSLRKAMLLLTTLWFIIAALVAFWISKKRPHIMTLDEEEYEEQLAHLNKELNERNRRLAEQEVSLEESNNKLKNIDALKSEFVSIVAHQLRTPLAGIKWTLDMLINGDLGSLATEQKSFLLKIHEGNERMIRFVNDLLSINRIETGRLEYNFTAINLEHVAESVLLDIYPLANKKQININFRGKGLKIPPVAADPEKIRVAFQNILENAVKYTPNGGHITLELRNRGGEVLVTVADDGIGMPKEEQRGIFNRFYRAPSAVKMQTEGSGLGLYLVKAIVEAHGGKVWFESERGRGTTFYFTVPVPRKES